MDDIDIKAKTRGFGIVKQYHPSKGKKAFPAYAYSGGPKHKSTTPSELQLSENTADITCTLVYSITIDEDFDEHAKLVKMLYAFLKAGRLGGGRIVNVNVDDISVTTDIENMIKSLCREKGWVVMNGYQQFDDLVDSVGIEQAMMDCTFAYAQTVGDQKLYRKRHPGWSFLNIRGYQFIGETKNREGVRGSKPHSFVEPIISLNLLERFRSRSLNTYFWSWVENPSAMLLEQNN